MKLKETMREGNSISTATIVVSLQHYLVCNSKTFQYCGRVMRYVPAERYAASRLPALSALSALDLATKDKNFMT